MSLNLDQLAELVARAVQQRGLDAEVVGVTPAEGDGCYAEVILDVADGAASRRLSVGVQRDAAPDEVCRRIIETIDANRHVTAS
jgi:hypothetical protein